MISWHRSLYLGQMISCCFSKCWLIPFKCLLAANISILICVYPMKSYGCLEMYNLEIMTPTNFILRQLALNAMNFDFRYLSYLNATMSILFSIYPSIWVTLKQKNDWYSSVTYKFIYEWNIIRYKINEITRKTYFFRNLDACLRGNFFSVLFVLLGAWSNSQS